MILVAKDIKKYIEPFLTLGKPIEYKGLKIHSLKVKDYYDSVSAIDILTKEKNKIPDIKVIQMSYLQYIRDELFEDMTETENKDWSVGKIWIYKFYTLLSVVFQVTFDKIVFSQNEKGKIVLKIADVEISAKEFDEIKDIILFSNISGYDNRYVDPDVQKIKDVYVNAKNNGVKRLSLEEQILFLIKSTGILKKDILEMTYRDFQIMFGLSVDEIEYQINKTAEMSGNVKFKQPIKHFLYGESQDIYEEMFSSMEETKEKFGS